MALYLHNIILFLRTSRVLAEPHRAESKSIPLLMLILVQSLALVEAGMGHRSPWGSGLTGRLVICNGG